MTSALFRLKCRAFAMSGSQVPPPDPDPNPGGVDYVFKPTWKGYIDLSAKLASVADDDWILLSVTGSVSALIWPVMSVSNGQAKLFRKRELLDEMMGGETVAASVSALAATWSLTWTGGSAEVTFAVLTMPAWEYVWNLGVLTRPRYGGFALTKFHATNGFEIVSQPTIAGQAAPFEIFPPPASNTDGRGARLVPRATNGTLTTYGTTRAVTTFPEGSLGNVVVRDLVTLQQYTIAVNGVAWTKDIAATPSTIPENDDNTGRFNNQFTVELFAGQFWGVTIAIEDGDMMRNSQSIKPATGDPRVVGPVGSPSYTQPIAVDANGYPTESFEVWRRKLATFRPKNYLGANLNKVVTYQTQFRPNLYVRLTGLRGAGTLAFTANPESGASSLQHSWVMVDHCRWGSNFGMSSTNNQSRFVFFMDNHITLSGQVNGQNSGIAVPCIADLWVVGNYIVTNYEDAIKHSGFDTVYDVGFSRIAWNVIWNKSQYRGVNTAGAGQNENTTHADFIQGYWNAPGSTPGLDGTLHDAPLTYGNITVRGNAPRTLLENRIGTDGQGVLYNDIIEGYHKLRFRIFGHLHQGVMLSGIHVNQPQPGSFIKNCTVLQAYDVVLTGDGSAVSPTIRIHNAVAANITVKDVVVSGDQFDSGGITPLGSGRVFSVDKTLALTYFADPMVGTPVATDQTYAIQSIIDGFTPVHSDLLAPPSGRVIGGVDPTKIDYRRRWYDPAILTP